MPHLLNAISLGCLEVVLSRCSRFFSECGIEALAADVHMRLLSLVTSLGTL